MVLARKAYRIEAMLGVGTGTGGPVSAGAHDRSDDILREIHELKKLIKPQQDISKDIISDYHKQFTEAYRLKVEMEGIQEAINRTKQEIASLHVSGFKGEEMSRVTDELDAVVGGTEQATNQILTATESIDEFATNLHAHLKGENQAMAADIQEKVLQIFEACNFQDLTGQRISKVVNVLRFIEDRVNRMMEIWGGMEAFATIESDESLRRVGDAALLNGPALPEANGTASQDDIDALFA
ncbi:protein phosphatase CheZ [Oryzibacter oryziterrae]|uniref:protein phosphatase CheZ n=1 Tax=Oryzibacter oryziterrae TaxID=2766474 RepID=UPI001F28D722|nr:protein phosphatase CheZ [Oryzibacter oryziterrae]